MTCCDGSGGWHSATLPNEAAVDAWVNQMLQEHPTLCIGTPYAKWGPPERIEMFDPRPTSGAIGRTVPLEGPITIGITLVRP